MASCPDIHVNICVNVDDKPLAQHKLVLRDFQWGKSPQRINGGKDHEPTPYCTGIGCKQEFHEHPGLLVKTLQEGHRLGQRNLEALFPVGAEFYYGPIYENMETRIRVTHVGTSGSGAHILRDHNIAHEFGGKAPATFFVFGEVVSSPYYEAGHTSGWPPATLIPADTVERERGLKPAPATYCTHAECDSFPTQPCQRVVAAKLESKVSELTAEVDKLRRQLEDARRGNYELRDLARRERDSAEQARKKVSAVYKALNNS